MSEMETRTGHGMTPLFDRADGVAWHFRRILLRGLVHLSASQRMATVWEIEQVSAELRGHVPSEEGQRMCLHPKKEWTT